MVNVEKAIRLAFLLPNTTVALQPLDQGIIKNIKLFNRRHTLERLVLCADIKDYTVTLRTAVTVVSCCCLCGLSVASGGQGREAACRPV